MPDTSSSEFLATGVGKFLEFGYKKILAKTPVVGGVVESIIGFFVDKLNQNDKELQILLNEAVNAIISSMRKLHNQELVNQINGLIRCFGEFKYHSANTPSPASAVHMFLHDSTRLMPKIENILLGQDAQFQDPKWAYIDSAPYNIIIPMRVIAKYMLAYNTDAIWAEYRNALRINYILVGEPICGDLVFDGNAFECPSGTRCYIRSRIWQHLFRHAISEDEFLRSPNQNYVLTCNPHRHVWPGAQGIHVNVTGHGKYGLMSPYGSEEQTIPCKEYLKKKFFEDEIVKMLCSSNEMIVSQLAACRVNVREYLVDSMKISLREDVYPDGEPICRSLRKQLEILRARS